MTLQSRRKAMEGNSRIIALALLAAGVLVCLPEEATRRLRMATRTGFTPLQAGLSLGFRRAGDTLTHLADAQRSIGEKRTMLAEIATLRQQTRLVPALKEENTYLKKLLSLEARQDRRLIACEVVVRNHVNGWWQTVTLDKGSEDGVRADMAVITVDGLVGRTAEVSPTACDALLICDPTSGLACRLPRTGAFGIVNGTGVAASGRVRFDVLCAALPCFMDYVSKDLSILANDEVVTSGLGGVFPAGLPVGRVAAVSVDPSGLYQRAEIVPSADLGSLRYVFIVAEE